MKALREMGSERRETVWFLSVMGYKEVQGFVYCTRGSTQPNHWFPGCHCHGKAGTLRLDERIVESINTRSFP